MVVCAVAFIPDPLSSNVCSIKGRAWAAWPATTRRAAGSWKPVDLYGLSWPATSPRGRRRARCGPAPGHTAPVPALLRRPRSPLRSSPATLARHRFDVARAEPGRRGFWTRIRPWWLIRVHEARASSRRARWLVRVRSSGWPFHQACSRIRRSKHSVGGRCGRLLISAGVPGGGLRWLRSSMARGWAPCLMTQPWSPHP
jgi:hypothetical protein